MGPGQKRHKVMVKQANKALENLKYEVANELGIDQSKIKGGYWGHLSARDCGAVGGHMVRKMIEAAEKSLTQQAGSFEQTQQANNKLDKKNIFTENRF